MIMYEDIINNTDLNHDKAKKKYDDDDCGLVGCMFPSNGTSF